MSARVHKWSPFAIIVTFILILDQVSKAWVLENMFVGETLRPIPALVPYFQITRSNNTGAAFGIFQGSGEILMILAIIITLVLIYFYAKAPQDARLQHIAFSLVIGGAVGNVIDRLQHGFVVDFVHLTLPNVISNVSNFADHAIVLGVVILLIESILSERAEKRQQAEMASEESTTPES